MTYPGVCLLTVVLLSTPCWWGAGVPLSQAGTGPPPAPHIPATSPKHGCYRSTTVRGLSPGSSAGVQGGQGEGSKKDSSRPSIKLSVKPSGRITAWGGGGLPRPEMAAWALSQPGLKPSHQGGQMGRAVFFLWPGQTASWLGPSSALPPSCLQPFCCPAPGLLVC